MISEHVYKHVSQEPINICKKKIIPPLKYKLESQNFSYELLRHFVD